MKLSLRWALLACLLLARFAGFAAADDAPAVRDAAGFFAPDTARKANEDIAALKKQYQVDVLIETFPSVVPDKLKQFQDTNAADRTQFFIDWSLERAAAAKLRGVYVLICRNPSYLHIEVGKNTQKQAFTLEDRGKLRDVLMASFKEKQFDKGLRAGLDLIRDTLARNLPPTRNPLVARAVKDYAGFFSTTAVEKANAALQALPRGPGKDVAIETFPTPPPDQIKNVESMSPAQRNKFFLDWAEERASKSKLDGVLVLICKRPGHARVDPHGSAARKLLTEGDVNQLSTELRARFNKKEFDQGLEDVVRLVSAKLAAADAVAALPPPVAGQVKDYGDFFSPPTVDKADVILQDIANRFKVAVLVETFKTVAPDKEKELETMPAAERTRFYTGIMKARRARLGQDGIQILITKHPGHLQVHVAEEKLKKAFTTADGEQLRQLMLTQFKAKRFDDGLIEAVALMRDRLLANVAGTAVAKVAPPPPPPVKTPDLPPKTADATPDVKPPLATTTPKDTEPAKAPPVAASSPPSAAAPTTTKEGSFLDVAKQKAQDVAQTQYPTWMWVVGIVGGLLVLWIFVGILRALFGGKRQPPVESMPQRPLPPANASYPAPGPGAGYAGPPQGGGYARPPQGGGYAMPPQQGYPMPPQAPPMPQGRGGGGFVSSMLGGMFGGAAGSWIYDSFRHGGSSSPAGPAYTPPTPPAIPNRPWAPPPAGSPRNDSGGEGYNAGGDFDSSTEAGAAGGGGDFDSPQTPARDSDNAGDDFGASSPAQADAGGGDFGAPSEAQADAGGGGDFGGDAASRGDVAQSDAGGDFGSPSSADQVSGGGDFGGDVAQNDTGSGGDQASTDTGASQGGDFT